MAVVKHLDVNEIGYANDLKVGDSFLFKNSADSNQHLITSDEGSHFVYDNKPSKKLSKDTLVQRVGKRDPKETLERAKAFFEHAIKEIEANGDVVQWVSNVEKLQSMLATYNYSELSLQILDKLQKLGVALFGKSKGKKQSKAIDTLQSSDRKKWQEEVKFAKSKLLQEQIYENLKVKIRRVLTLVK